MAPSEPPTDPMVRVSTPGEVGYQGYFAKTGGKTFDGRDMPEWSELPQNIKDAWEAASARVLDCYFGGPKL